MNVWGPLGKLQHKGAGFYQKLAERFRDNTVVRETWTAMAQDLDAQAASLRCLRPSFWKQLKTEEKSLLQAIAAAAADGGPGSVDPRGWSLHTIFERTLELEEQFSLRIYAPVVHRLREQEGRALDFYVMVTAHLTRLQRLIQPFSGDPALIQRCVNLLHNFEREAQGLKAAPPAPKRSVSQERRRSEQMPARRPVRPARNAAARVALTRRTAPRKHAKPIVEDIKLTRRRARR